MSEVQEVPQSIEQKKPTVEFAGFWPRLVAIVIDSIILGLLDGCVSTFLGNAIEDAPAVWDIVLGLVVFLIPIVYFVSAYSGSGQTPGKSLLRIRVVAIDGSPLNWRKGFLRYLGYFTSTIVFFLGFLWLIWDPNKQAWHDKIAGTCVVRSRVTRESLQDTIDPSQAWQRRKRWLMWLGIPTILLSVVGYGAGLFFLIQSATEQENPLITSWRSQGLVESAQFVTRYVSVSGSQPFTVLELVAWVPHGTLDDKGKVEQLADRLSSEIYATEDMLVVILIEETGVGCLNTRQWEYVGYPQVGKEHLFDQMWEAYESLPKNVWDY